MKPTHSRLASLVSLLLLFLLAFRATPSLAATPQVIHGFVPSEQLEIILNENSKKEISAVKPLYDADETIIAHCIELSGNEFIVQDIHGNIVEYSYNLTDICLGTSSATLIAYYDDYINQNIAPSSFVDAIGQTLTIWLIDHIRIEGSPLSWQNRTKSAINSFISIYATGTGTAMQYTADYISGSYLAHMGSLSPRYQQISLLLLFLMVAFMTRVFP